MTLTPVQKKFLIGYRSFHLRAPTFGYLFRLNLRGLGVLFLVTLIGVSLALSSQFQLTAPGLFVAGMGFGSMLRVVGQIRLSTKAWPALNEVIDWEKVDALLLEEKKS